MILLAYACHFSNIAYNQVYIEACSPQVDISHSHMNLFNLVAIITLQLCFSEASPVFSEDLHPPRGPPADCRGGGRPSWNEDGFGCCRMTKPPFACPVSPYIDDLE